MLTWYSRAKETELGGKASRKSEQPIRARKVGNRDRPGPSGAKGLPEKGIVGGKDAGHIKAQGNLNETTADSGTGETDAGEGADIAVASHGR
jgi:hypothetical protein